MVITLATHNRDTVMHEYEFQSVQGYTCANLTSFTSFSAACALCKDGQIYS